MTNNDTVASRLISRRAEMGLSQNQLAIQAKIAPAQISRYEAGMNKPSVKTMGKLAEALAVPFEWLAYGDTSNFSIDAPKAKGEIDYWLQFPDDVYNALMTEAGETGKSFDEVVIQRLKLYQEMVDSGIINEDDEISGKEK